MAYIEKGEKKKRERFGRDLENHKYYHTSKWLRLRKQKLKRNPLCELCSKKGLTVPADEVHHIVPISADPKLAYYYPNLMSLCSECHHQIHNQMRQKKG